MSNDLTKRLMWSGLLAGVGALATIVATRIATYIWIKIFDEDPPERLMESNARPLPPRRPSGRRSWWAPPSSAGSCSPRC